MEITESEAIVESVTMTEILNLSSWDRPRSHVELSGFIARHEANLPEESDN